MDRPERGTRFTRWVRRLEAGDSLLVAGDLCDFWMAARVRQSALLECDALRALAEFRSRGGSLAIMSGNHDRWLCPFYEKSLGATLLPEPLDTTIHGIRLHVVHGHLLGARQKWKALLETKQFWSTFGQLPLPLAAMLDRLLERKNRKELDKDERRHLAVFREYAASRRGLADIVVIGHVHRAVDEPSAEPRLIVLGGWQEQSSYLRIDPAGAAFCVVADPAVENPRPAVAARVPASTEPRFPSP
jgi:UDP-2,3-diacylglucosamine hydrolase